MRLPPVAAPRPQPPAACLCLALLASALATRAPAEERPVPEVEAPPAFPHLSLDVDMNLYGLATPRATTGRREGISGFLFGHINPGLHLAPEFSLQAFIHPDAAGPYEPNGATTFLRRQNVILEQLFAEWRPVEGLQLYAGKFNAPFGYGYEYFPGVLASFRAHAVYLIREQIGLGANWVLPAPEAAGEVTLSAAAFTLDTSFLANSLVTRRRCCDGGFDRYVRTTRREGGPGNTGNLDNVALSLEGEAVPALPGLTWNLGLLSRAPGKDGTRREWAWAAGLRYEHAWNGTLRGLAFGEFVEFRNAGGSPVEEVADGSRWPVAARRRFFTLGAQLQQGPWRATLVWQQEEERRSHNTLPMQRWLEASVGRDLAWGFGLDLGYQHARFAQEDGRRGEAHSIVARLNYRFTR